jgi:hypothetical protein
MTAHVIVWDLETVPDLKGYAAANDLEGKSDDEIREAKRLRSIEAALCGKYLVNRYHKLPDEARFSMVVTFEGEVKCGTRHAHMQDQEDVH